MSHAYVLVSLKNNENPAHLAELILQEGLSCKEHGKNMLIFKKPEELEAAIGSIESKGSYLKFRVDRLSKEKIEMIKNEKAIIPRKHTQSLDVHKDNSKDFDTYLRLGNAILCLHHIFLRPENKKQLAIARKPKKPVAAKSKTKDAVKEPAKKTTKAKTAKKPAKRTTKTKKTTVKKKSIQRRTAVKKKPVTKKSAARKKATKKK